MKAIGVISVMILMMSIVRACQDVVKATKAFVENFKGAQFSNVVFFNADIDDSSVWYLTQTFNDYSIKHNKVIGISSKEDTTFNTSMETLFVVTDPSTILWPRLDPFELSKNIWLLFDLDLSQVDLHPRLDSEVYACQGKNLVELYTIPGLDHVIQSVVGEFSQDSFHYQQPPYKWERRSDLMGSTITAVYVDSAPFVFKGRDNQLSGIMFEVAQTMEKDLNFTFELREDHIYGQLLDNGSWLGMIGSLQRQEVDVSISDISITYARSQVVDFGLGVYLQYGQLFMRLPKASLSWTTFVNVFNHVFWLILLLSIGATSILFHTVNTMSGDDRKRHLVKALASTLLAFGALSIPENPSKVPPRVLFLTICLFGAIIYWSYNAILVSLLTVDIKILPIQSLDDLAAKQGQYQILIEKGNAYTAYFEDATDTINPVAKDIYEKSILNNDKAFVISKEETELLLENDPSYVLFMESASTKQLFEGYPCRIQAAPPKYFKNHVSFAFQKHSPLVELMSSRILSLKQSGQVNKLLHKYLGSKDGLTCEEGEFKPIKISTIFTAFLSLLLGIAAAVVIGVSERFLSVAKT